MLSASEVRGLMVESEQEIIDSIGERIVRVAKEGKESIFYNRHFPDSIVDGLRFLGYTVIVAGKEENLSEWKGTTISWKKEG